MTTRTAFLLRSDATLAVYQRTEDKLDYALDYTELVGTADSISVSTWSATGTLTLTNPQQDGAVVSIDIEGAGGTVTNAVQTALGRKKTVSFCVLPAAVADCA